MNSITKQRPPGLSMSESHPHSPEVISSETLYYPGVGSIDSPVQKTTTQTVTRESERRAALARQTDGTDHS